jgi:ABC-2 type transport system permease protein
MNPKQAFIAFWTIVRDEGFRMLRLWKQTLLPPAITSVLYFVIFGHVIGKRIGSMHGIQYATFIAPGLIMMQMITSAYSAATFSFYFAKFSKSIQEILVSPMSNMIILSSYMCVGMLRGLSVGVVVGIVAMIFADLHGYSACGIIFTSLISTAIFSLAGVINGVFANKFDDIAIIPNFVITPLTYFGGVFYSINMLPYGFREISLINPIYYIVDSFRYGFLGLNAPMIETSVCVLVGLFVLAFVVALYIFKKGAGLRP